MHSHRTAWTPADLCSVSPSPERADLVLAFGPRALLEDVAVFDAVRQRYPSARIAGASTGGEILDGRVLDETLTTAAIAFETTSVDVVWTPAADAETDQALGRELAAQLAPADAAGRPLAHVVVLGDGVTLNGSDLAAGVEAGLPAPVAVTGGLAGDGAQFAKTVLWADGLLREPAALAVAFYGDHLRVGVGAGGGWDTFGIERTVTRSAGNVLVELDGRPALDLYRDYLGAHAAELPASGLRFPLSVGMPGGDYELVRTLLRVDRDAGTLTFAGDIPQGATARLMRSNPDRLVDGALSAATRARTALGTMPELSLMVSCVGRKWTMGERAEEEVEEAALALDQTATVGFYSYGELASAEGGSRCELHNQTLTVTAFSEARAAPRP